MSAPTEVTILIAEDDAGHARLIEKNLERAGLHNRILRFGNGQAILDFLFQRGAGPFRAPEMSYLILLDIRMPQVDGIEVLRQIKYDPELRKIPVIMLTTTDDPREVERCHAIGCNSYIVKPVDYDKFAEAIKSLGLYISLVQVPEDPVGEIIGHRMEEGANQRTVLVVDDDRGLLRLIEKALQREGFTTASAASGAEALAWLAKNRADLLLLDLKLEDIGGKELVHHLAESGRSVPFIIITGQGDERVAVDMMKRGARDYLVKDVDFLQFVPAVVKHAIEQIETERRLAVAEERVHLVQSVMERGFSAVLIATADLPDPVILYVTPTFARLTGCVREQVVGQRVSALSGLTAVQERLRQGVPEADSFLEEASPYQTAGGERWGEWRLGPVKDKAGRITHWLVILRDITDRKRLEREILEISDREQRRIGQDLHDGLCQELAGIELMSQVLEQKLAVKSKADAAVVHDIAAHVRHAIGQTRLLARGLSPVTLESEGLMSALEELASNTEKIFGVTCRFTCAQPVLLDDHTAATHLFRIAQEAVSNAIKHGKASEITMELARQRGRIVLVVSDNGAGFPAVIPQQSGMGLRIMRSRSAMIGGIFSVGNNFGKGARVTCSVALPSLIKQNEERRGRKKQKSKSKKTGPHR